MTYRPKWQIGLERYDPAVGNGLSFDWFTFDEGYGGKPDFLRGLSARRQRFVGEVPRSFTGWLTAPRIVTRPYATTSAPALRARFVRLEFSDDRQDEEQRRRTNDLGVASTPRSAVEHQATVGAARYPSLYG